MTRNRLLHALLLLPLLLVAACDGGSDDDFSLVGTNLSVSDIAGAWVATRAAFSPEADGPAQEVDLVAQGGTVTLNIQNNGRFTLTLSLPGAPPETATGRLGFDEDLLVVSFDDDPDDFDFFGIQATPTTLSVQGPGEFDFDGDGTDEAARLELDFVRA